MRALITGVTGFAGSHLADLLNTIEGMTVFGLKRRRSDLSNLQSPCITIDCEITDALSVENAIREANPDLVFHLAGQSFVPLSWSAPSFTFEVNLMGSINLFEAVRKIKPDVPIQVAGSSEEYGLVTEKECLITEEQPLRPLSPYGVSKAAMDLLAQQYVRSYGMKIIITRAFNHTGPRRGEVFATSNFAKQVAMIKLGQAPPVIFVGNLEARRDFTDVRDMVEAYYQAIRFCKPGTPYNICSSTAHPIKTVLEILIDIAHIHPTIEQSPDRMRPSDVPLLLGSYRKFHEATDWDPTIDFEQTMKDLFNYWMERLQK